MRHPLDSRRPSGPSHLSGDTEVDAREARWADDGGRTTERLPRESPAFGLFVPESKRDEGMTPAAPPDAGRAVEL
jgi:hypothetical protein